MNELGSHVAGTSASSTRADMDSQRQASLICVQCGKPKKEDLISNTGNHCQHCDRRTHNEDSHEDNYSPPDYPVGGLEAERQTYEDNFWRAPTYSYRHNSSIDCNEVRARNPNYIHGHCGDDGKRGHPMDENKLNRYYSLRTPLRTHVSQLRSNCRPQMKCTSHTLPRYACCGQHCLGTGPIPRTKVSTCGRHRSNSTLRHLNALPGVNISEQQDFEDSPLRSNDPSNCGGRTGSVGHSISHDHVTCAAASDLSNEEPYSEHHCSSFDNDAMHCTCGQLTFPCPYSQSFVETNRIYPGFHERQREGSFYKKWNKNSQEYPILFNRNPSEEDMCVDARYFNHGNDSILPTDCRRECDCSDHVHNDLQLQGQCSRYACAECELKLQRNMRHQMTYSAHHCNGAYQRKSTWRDPSVVRS